MSLAESPGFFYVLFFYPLTTLFTLLHYLILNLRGAPYLPPKAQIPIRVVCISDTHSKIPPQSLPEGDLLIHCGNLTKNGTLGEMQRSVDWLKTLLKQWYGAKDGYRYIVVVCGSQDTYLDQRTRSLQDKRYEKTRKLDWGKIIYLDHESVTLPFLGDRNLNVYGTPQIAKRGDKAYAFQYERGQDAWSNVVPDDTDVLVTHQPPKWHMDVSERGGLGDEHELKEVWRTKPTLHTFGHTHAGAGTEYIWWDQGQKLFEQLKQQAFGTQKQFGLISEVLDVRLVMLGFQMLWQDVRGLFWTRFWGGARNGSFMVNACLTSGTNKLGNKPQVVVL